MLSLFSTNTNGKDYNCKRYYQTKHEEKYKEYVGESREEVINNLKKKIKLQTGIFNKVRETQRSALHALYAVVLQLAKCNKPLIDGMMVKQ